MNRTSLIVFDVNETLSDMTPVRARFADVGAPELLAQVWFASVLRDGFALTAAGAFAHFSDLAQGALVSVLAGVPLNRGLDDAVSHVLGGFSSLGVHSDVPEGTRRLRREGLRLVTLTNGSTDIAERLLTEAGIRPDFERLISVDAAGVWKPAHGAYEYAATVCGVTAAEALLVAVHPWDIDGAARAGMRTAWIDRSGVPYPAYFAAPDITVSALPELVAHLGHND